MNAPAAIIFLILFVGLLRPLPFLLYLVFILPVFGSLAMLPPALAGGSSLTAGSFAAFFLVIRGFTSQKIVSDSVKSLTNFRQLGLLGLFLVVAVIGAFVLPHIFAGSVRVYSMRIPRIAPVESSTANYTQAAYLILSTLTAVVTSVLIHQPSFREAIPKAAIAGGYAVIVTGLLDAAMENTGTSGALSMFYTAEYGFSGGEIEGAHRIVGLMPEAAAYGSMAAGMCALLLFLRPAFPPHLWKFKAPLVGWGCGLMAILSQSSTAYGMMGVVLFLYAFYRMHRIGPDGSIVKKAVSKKVLAWFKVLGIILLVLLFDSDLAAHFVKLVDALLFHKKESSSYIERSEWTAAAWNGFLESDGLGLGVGSVRTSNFFVNIIASTGILGAVLFGLFLIVMFTRRALKKDNLANVVMHAAKLTLIPVLVGAAVAGTTPDFGIFEGMLFGMIAGLSQSEKRELWISPLARKQTAQLTNAVFSRTEK